MRLRTLAALWFILAGALYYLIPKVAEGFKTQYRESIEETLIDTASFLSAQLGARAESADVVAAVNELRATVATAKQRPVEARVYDYLKRSIDLRLLVTDQRGIVLYDSRGLAEGRDYGRWNDIYLTLRGKYGARTTRDDQDDPTTSVLYVAAPLVVRGSIAGVLSVGKPVTSQRFFIAGAKRRLTALALIAVSFALIPCLVLSWWLSRPFEQLTAYARAVAKGQRASLPKLATSEARILGYAFEEMRRALEGRRYVEHYVQSLTHELKAPLSAIKGAAELLEDPMPEQERQKFLANIADETARMHEVIDDLLELASLEAIDSIEVMEDVDVGAIADEVCGSLGPSAAKRGVRIERQGPSALHVQGDLTLLFRALRNLVVNALEFSPDGGAVIVEVRNDDEKISLAVLDTGPGIPEYAREKIFDRFYSLPRPSTGRKSSGLGLPFVKQVATLHGGSVRVTNRSPGPGVRAELLLPALARPREP